MALDFTNEVDEIINSEIGDDAILVITSTGEVKTIRVVFHKEFSLEDNLESPEEAYQLWAECKTSDVEDAEQNDTITIRTVDYNVETVEPSDSNWTILRLTT